MVPSRPTSIERKKSRKLSGGITETTTPSKRAVHGLEAPAHREDELPLVQRAGEGGVDDQPVRIGVGERAEQVVVVARLSHDRRQRRVPDDAGGVGHADRSAPRQGHLRGLEQRQPVAGRGRRPADALRRGSRADAAPCRRGRTCRGRTRRSRPRRSGRAARRAAAPARSATRGPGPGRRRPRPARWRRNSRRAAWSGAGARNGRWKDGKWKMVWKMVFHLRSTIFHQAGFFQPACARSCASSSAARARRRRTARRPSGR